jgi:hypothetical protein
MTSATRRGSTRIPSAQRGSDGQPGWAIWAQSAGLCSGGSDIDRRNRRSVGVLCRCNRWCRRGSGGMDRAHRRPATAGPPMTCPLPSP